jgi:hypothetical protein
VSSATKASGILSRSCGSAIASGANI